MSVGVVEAGGEGKDSQAMRPARGMRKARTGPAHGAETQQVQRVDLRLNN